MQLHCSIEGNSYTALLSEGIDLSQGFGPGGDNALAFHIPAAEIAPIRVGDFVGSVAAGSGANCEVIQFCAHGNGTHSECLGHITHERHSVNKLIRSGLMAACLVSVTPEKRGSDWVITASGLNDSPMHRTPAIIIRTNNISDIRGKNWSGTNPCYFEPAAIQMLVDAGYEHILTDLPSIDREEDGGALASHHVWWQYPQQPRMHASITELIVVPEKIQDDLYLLNLQIAPIESDAAPSRPVIFPLTATKP
jgi:kynurenine formamidase